MKITIALLFTTLTLSAKELPDAQVTLPYSEIRELLRKVENLKDEQKQQSPVSAIISNAAYELTLDQNDSAQGTVTFHISSLSDRWQLLPILDSRSIITQIEPAEALIMTEKELGNYSLVLKKTGHTKLTVHFLIPQSEDHLFRFYAPPATSAGMTLTNSNAAPLKINGAHQNKLSHNLYHIPSSGGFISGKRGQQKQSRPTQWKSTVESLITSNPEELTIQSKFQLSTDEVTPGYQATIELPRLAEIKEVKSSHLEKHRVFLGDQNTTQNLELHWNSEGIANRQFSVIYTMPRPLDKGQWNIQLPRLETPLKTTGTVVIVAPDELTLSSKNIKPLEQALPSWMKPHVHSSTPLILNLNEQQQCLLESIPKQRMAISQLTIKKSQYETLIVNTGGLLTKGTIELEHDGPASWNFTLPDGAHLLTCSIDNISTNPIQNTNNALELPLKNPSGKSIIHLSFTTKTSPLNPVEGSLSLSLLQTKIFKYEQCWNIQLPSEYETTAVDGNLPFDPRPSKGQKLHLIKKLSQNETPFIQVYYQKKSLKH